MDSLITRLLEGESGPGRPRGGGASLSPPSSSAAGARGDPPFPPRGGPRGGGEEAGGPGGAASGNTAEGRPGVRGCPRRQVVPQRTFGDPHGGAPAGVPGDPSRGGCRDACSGALYARGTCISSLFSLCLALGCLRFLLPE